MKTDGSNAVQLLLFVGGISLVPALLFTVTGFTRILIVLGFIRQGLGTPTAPPPSTTSRPASQPSASNPPKIVPTRLSPASSSSTSPASPPRAKNSPH